MLNKLT